MLVHVCFLLLKSMSMPREINKEKESYVYMEYKTSGRKGTFSFIMAHNALMKHLRPQIKATDKVYLILFARIFFTPIGPSCSCTRGYS